MERRAAGAADSVCPPLPTRLARRSPLPLVLSEAVTQTGRAARLLPLRFLLPFLPARPSPPPFNLSLPPSLRFPLVIKENSSWPDRTSNAVPPFPSSPRPSPSIQPLMPGAQIGEPTEGGETPATHRFLSIPSNFALGNVSCQRATLQLRLLPNPADPCCPRLRGPGTMGRFLEDGVGADNLEVGSLKGKRRAAIWGNCSLAYPEIMVMTLICVFPVLSKPLQKPNGRGQNHVPSAHTTPPPPRAKCVARKRRVIGERGRLVRRGRV